MPEAEYTFPLLGCVGCPDPKWKIPFYFFAHFPCPYLISHMRQILKYTLLEAFDNTQLEAE